MNEEEIAEALRQLRQSIERLTEMVARLAQTTLGEQAGAEVRQLRPKLRDCDDDE